MRVAERISAVPVLATEPRREPANLHLMPAMVALDELVTLTTDTFMLGSEAPPSTFNQFFQHELFLFCWRWLRGLRLDSTEREAVFIEL